MSSIVETLIQKYYSNDQHPYRIFEKRVDTLLKETDTLLDAGCGRTAPILRRYIGKAKRLIGVELVSFKDVPSEIETYNADLTNIPLESESVDLIMSRSVFEHIQNPLETYLELNRILKPGGSIVFLTANMWDYATLVAQLVPNQFHSRIVKFTEGRSEEDTFPTAYKTNTKSAIFKLAKASNLDVSSFKYLSQYPNYLKFSAPAFMLGMAYEKLISRFDSLGFLRGWILVTLNKPTKKQHQ